MDKNEKVISRKEKWSSYRSEINRESLSLSDDSLESNKLNKLKKKINDINPNILMNVDNQIEFNPQSEVQLDIASSYKNLNFEINYLNQSTIDKINHEINDIENIKSSYFLMDNEGNLSNHLFNNYEASANTLNVLQEKIDQVSKLIQNFPIVASEDLKILNNSIEHAKQYNQSPSIINGVSTASISESKDFKKWYFVIIGVSFALIVLIIIMVILLLVL